MSKEYEYKGHKIAFNEASAEFTLRINGRHIRSTSLEGAKRQIEKYAVKEFVPTDVVIVERDKKGKRVAKVTKLVAYTENRPYGTRDLERYVETKEGEKFNLAGGWRVRGRIFNLAKHDKVKELIAELDRQEEIKDKASDEARKIEKQLNEMGLDMASVDPKGA